MLLVGLAFVLIVCLSLNLFVFFIVLPSEPSTGLDPYAIHSSFFCDFHLLFSALSSHFACLLACLLACLVGWLVAWLAGWLLGWLVAVSMFRLLFD